jgi:hypothetical protein
MKTITSPVTGAEFVTVESLGEWDEVFQSLGARKHDFGFFTIAGWIAEHGNDYEHRVEDYSDEKAHGGELLGECVRTAYKIANERSLPYVSGFATSRSGAWVPHCWNLNAYGRVLDLTWHCPQYEASKVRRYRGCRMKNCGSESNPLFEALHGNTQRAGIDRERFEYVLHQVAMGRYIVRDWYGLAYIHPRTNRRLLREAEFTNQMTIRDCERFATEQEDVLLSLG